MERKLTIEDLNTIKKGTLIVANFLGGDHAMVFSSKFKTYLYPFSNKNGKGRTVECDGGGIKTVYAKDEGNTGEEQEYEYCFDGFGSLTVHEHDAQECIDGFNMRLIDENHPLYDIKLNQAGEMMGTFFDKLAEVYGENDDGEFTEKDEKDIFGSLTAMMKEFKSGKNAAKRKKRK